MSCVPGLRFRVLPLVPGTTYEIGLESRVPPKVSGLVSHFWDMPFSLFLYEYKFTTESKNEQKKTFTRHLNT